MNEAFKKIHFIGVIKSYGLCIPWLVPTQQNTLVFSSLPLKKNLNDFKFLVEK